MQKKKNAWMTSLTATPEAFFSSPACPRQHLYRYCPHSHIDRHIRFGIVASPWGQCLLATSAYGICHLGFLSAMSGAEAFGSLQRQWRDAIFLEDEYAMAKVAENLFGGASANPGSNDIIKVIVKATDFQWSVWKALLLIPPGSVSSYQAIATRIGSPAASRAVGSAVGKNPVAWLIPCHRVLPKTGGPGGYRWGVACKQKLLADEGVAPGHIASDLA